MDRIALHSFMARHRYGVVSSTSGDDTPQSALVGIAITPDLEIIFDTVKSSRKYRNLIARPACSFVVCRSGEEQREVESYFDSLILSCRGSLGLSADTSQYVHNADSRAFLRRPGTSAYLPKRSFPECLRPENV